MASHIDYYRGAAGVILRHRLTRPSDISTTILTEEDVKDISDMKRIPGQIIGFFTRDRHGKPSFVILKRDRKRNITRVCFVYYDSDLRYYNSEKEIIKRFLTKQTEIGVINVQINLEECLAWSVMIHMVEYILGPTKLYQGKLRQSIFGTPGCASFTVRRIVPETSRISTSCTTPHMSESTHHVWSLMKRYGLKLYTASCMNNNDCIPSSLDVNVIQLEIRNHYVYGVIHRHWRTLMVLLPHRNQFTGAEDIYRIKRQFRLLLRGEDVRHIVASRFICDSHVECNSSMIAKACFLLLMMPLYTIRDCDVKAFLPRELVDNFCSSDTTGRVEPTYSLDNQETGESNVVISEIGESEASSISVNLSGPSGEPEIVLAKSPPSSQTVVPPKAIEAARTTPALHTTISAGQAMMERLAEIDEYSSAGTSSFVDPQDYSDVPSPNWDDEVTADCPSRILSRRTSHLSVQDDPSSSHDSSQSTIICFEEAAWYELAQHEKREDLNDAMGSLIPPVAPMKPMNDIDGLLQSSSILKDNLSHMINCSSYIGNCTLAQPLQVDDLKKRVPYSNASAAKFVLLPIMASNTISLLILDHSDDETGELVWGFMDPESHDGDGNTGKMQLIEDYLHAVAHREDIRGHTIQLQTQFHAEYPKIHLLLGVYTITRYFKYVKRIPPRVIYNERDFREYCYRLCQDLAITNHKYNLAHHLVRESGYLKSGAFTSLPSPVKFVTCPVKSDQCPFCFSRKFKSLSSHMIMEHGGLAKKARAHRGA